jgi:hypothetical protein
MHFLTWHKKLILEVGHYPISIDFSDPNYSNQLVTDNIWKVISKKMKFLVIYDLI